MAAHASSTDHGELMISELTMASPVSANSAGLAGRCASVERIWNATSSTSSGHSNSSLTGPMPRISAVDALSSL
jgi:hypothetical protein